MGMIDDLMFEEDMKFIEMTNNAMEHYRLTQLRRAWIDRHGVAHILIPSVVFLSDKPVLGKWRYVCGWRLRDYRDHDEGAVPTCLACITKDVTDG